MIAYSLMIAASVAAQTPPAAGATQDDLRCIAVVAAAIGMQKDEADSAGLAAGMMYFMGRIEGRQPGYDLERNLTALMNRSDAEIVLKANAERCSKALTERGTFLQVMGGRMQAEGKQ